MANVAKNLAGIDVLDTEGRSVHLADQWQNRPVVLMFIRHFG